MFSSPGKGMKRKRSGYSKVTNYDGSKTVATFKHGRMRRAPNKLAARIQKALIPQNRHTIREEKVVDSTVAGTCQWLTITSGTPAHLTALQTLANNAPVAGAVQPYYSGAKAQYSGKFQIQGYESTLQLVNMSEVGVQLEIYEVIARENCEATGNFQNLVTTGYNYIVGDPNGADQNPIANDPSTTIWQNPLLVNYFKITKKRFVHLKAGESLSVNQSHMTPKTFNPIIFNDINNNFYAYRNYTRGFVIKLVGNIVDTNISGTIATSTAAIRCKGLLTTRYYWSAFPGIGVINTTAGGTLPAALPNQEQFINEANGLELNADNQA